MNCDYTDIRCSDISCDLCEKIQMHAYNKAIDDFAEKVKEMYAFTILEEEQLNEITKQLKAGGDNEQNI